MALENALIAKIIGSITVLGGAGSAGVVYRAEIANQLQNIFGKKEEIKNYLFVVGGTVAITDPSTKTLYDAKEPKTKNYQCQIGEKKYECDIISEITDSNVATKKWINTKSYFSETDKTADAVTKEKIKAANSLFLLKIISDEKLSITWSGASITTIDIIEKEIPVTGSASVAPKKFGQLKPIFGKENNEILGEVNLFLAQVISTGSTDVGTGTKKCYFDNEDAAKKPCEIYKFTDTQSTTLNAENSYSSSNFVGTNLTEEQKIKTTPAIKQYEWYLIKFTGNLLNSDFSGKKLVYVEDTTDTTAKKIDFSTPLVSFIFPQTGTNNNLLIIND